MSEGNESINDLCAQFILENAPSLRRRLGYQITAAGLRRLIDSDDIMQSALRRMCQSERPQVSIQNFNRIAKQVLIDQIRKHRSQKRNSGKTRGESAFKDAASGELLSIDNFIESEDSPELSMRLEEFINSIGNKKLESFAHYYLEGMEIEAIAKKMDVSRSTAYRMEAQLFVLFCDHFFSGR